MVNETKLFYDLTAQETADEWYHNQLLLPNIREFMAFLPERARVLDLGCGTGHESRRLATNGAKVYGVDYSDECIRIARERCPECQFAVMDFRHLNPDLGVFDGVFACASLIHIAPEELGNVVQGIAPFIKEKG